MADIRQTINLPPSETIAYFRAKGYATQAHWDEMWQQDHNRAFTVTKLLDRKLLEEVRGSLDKVLSTGGTFEMWKADIVPKMQGAGWFGRVEDREKTGVDHAVFIGEARLRTIYDTNLRVARAAGKWKRIQTLKAAAPYLMWDAIKDRRTRPLHRLWGGLDNGRPIILPVDHPAWAIYFPPCGWGCRCGVIQLSERDLRRRNLRVTTDAELRTIGWLTESGEVGGDRKPYRRTDGTIEQVPAGIDPGFAYNPGEDYMASLRPPPAAGSLPAPAIGPKPLPPMPEPRERPASVLLDPETPPEQAIDTFLSHFPEKPAAGAIATHDKMGEPLNLDDSFFYRRGEGRTETPKFEYDKGRLSSANLLAESLLDPDEIWIFWEEVTDRSGVVRKRLRRRYVSRFTIDGKTRSYVVVTDFGEGGWQGVTAFKARRQSYLDKDGIRGGVLVYRRT